MKTCVKCKKSKPLSAFGKHACEADGHQSRCRECRSRKEKLWAAVRPSYRKQRKIRCRAWYVEHKETISAAAKIHYQNNKDHYRNKNLLQTFGISLNDYTALLAEQKGKCAICGRTDPKIGKKNNRFHVDHDHENGKIRGLLCIACNAMLGFIKDNPDTLRAALKYLAHPPATTHKIGKAINLRRECAFKRKKFSR